MTAHIYSKVQNEIMIIANKTLKNTHEQNGESFPLYLPCQHGFVNKVMEKPFTVILLLLKFSVKSEEVKFETKR